MNVMNCSACGKDHKKVEVVKGISFELGSNPMMKFICPDTRQFVSFWYDGEGQEEEDNEE